MAPEGELDVSTAQAVREQLAARPWRCELVVLDLRGLTFCDTSGIRLVVETMQELQGLEVGFAILRGSKDVQRPFALARMEQRLPFADDLEHAVSAL